MTNDTNLSSSKPLPEVPVWKEIVARYQQSSTWRATWQIINTLVPYCALWYLMHLCLAVSWWLVLPLAVLAGAFLVRVFIIFHDCGHGSFFKSPAANPTRKACSNPNRANTSNWNRRLTKSGEK